jgi:hypothetical protein
VKVHCGSEFFCLPLTLKWCFALRFDVGEADFGTGFDLMLPHKVQFRTKFVGIAHWV